MPQRVPGGLGSQISVTFGTRRWWGCQRHSPAAFTPRRCSWYSFSLGAESTPGPWSGRKEYVTKRSSDTTGNRSRNRPFKRLTQSQKKLNYSPEISLFFHLNPPNRMRYFHRLGTRLKIPSLWKSGSCIGIHSRTSISPSSLRWETPNATVWLQVSIQQLLFNAVSIYDSRPHVLRLSTSLWAPDSVAKHRQSPYRIWRPARRKRKQPTYNA